VVTRLPRYSPSSPLKGRNYLSARDGEKPEHLHRHPGWQLHLRGLDSEWQAVLLSRLEDRRISSLMTAGVSVGTGASSFPVTSKVRRMAS